MEEHFLRDQRPFDPGNERTVTGGILQMVTLSNYWVANW